MGPLLVKSHILKFWAKTFRNKWYANKVKLVIKVLEYGLFSPGWGMCWLYVCVKSRVSDLGLVPLDYKALRCITSAGACESWGGTAASVLFFLFYFLLTFVVPVNIFFSLKSFYLFCLWPKNIFLHFMNSLGRPVPLVQFFLSVLSPHYDSFFLNLMWC